MTSFSVHQIALGLLSCSRVLAASRLVFEPHTCSFTHTRILHKEPIEFAHGGVRDSARETERLTCFHHHKRKTAHRQRVRPARPALFSLAEAWGPQPPDIWWYLNKNKSFLCILFTFTFWPRLNSNPQCNFCNSPLFFQFLIVTGCTDRKNGLHFMPEKSCVMCILLSALQDTTGAGASTKQHQLCSHSVHKLETLAGLFTALVKLRLAGPDPDWH